MLVHINDEWFFFTAVFVIKTVKTILSKFQIQAARKIDHGLEPNKVGIWLRRVDKT